MTKRKKRRLRKSVRIGILLIMAIVLLIVSLITLRGKNGLSAEINEAYAQKGDRETEIIVERSNGTVNCKDLVRIWYQEKAVSKDQICADPETIDTSVTDRRTVTYTADISGKEKKVKMDVTVKDTVSPVIVPLQEQFTAAVGNIPDYSAMFRVQDLGQPISYFDEKQKDGSWYTVTADTDYQTEGEYSLHVTADDGYGNISEHDFPIRVVSQESAAEENNSVSGSKDDIDSILVVANKKNPLPYEYEPSDLRLVNCSTNYDGWYLRDIAASAIEEMFAAASQQGVTLICKSGYRSASYQDTLYSNYVGMYGVEEADRISSRPGYSDHQTGLAMDIGDHDLATVFTQEMENTIEGQWLYEHAHEFGFILRYPKGKESITGYSFEPWHYRYVGKETATKMYEISPDYTLEEYTGTPGGDYSN